MLPPDRSILMVPAVVGGGAGLKVDLFRSTFHVPIQGSAGGVWAADVTAHDSRQYDEDSSDSSFHENLLSRPCHPDLTAHDAPADESPPR
jgi:hypothetical protein